MTGNVKIVVGDHHPKAGVTIDGELARTLEDSMKLGFGPSPAMGARTAATW